MWKVSNYRAVFEGPEAPRGSTPAGPATPAMPRVPKPQTAGAWTPAAGDEDYFFEDGFGHDEPHGSSPGARGRRADQGSWRLTPAAMWKVSNYRAVLERPEAPPVAAPATPATPAAPEPQAAGASPPAAGDGDYFFEDSFGHDEPRGSSPGAPRTGATPRPRRIGQRTEDRGDSARSVVQRGWVTSRGLVAGVGVLLGAALGSIGVSRPEFWHLVRGLGLGAGARGDALGDDLPARRRAVAPPLRNRSAGGTAVAGAAGELEWQLHAGVLCKPSDETLDTELEGSLTACQENCVQEPRCGAVQTLSGMMFGKCRLLDGVDQTMCTKDPKFDLWQQVEKTTITVTTATATTTATTPACPACAPKEHKPPAIVIPTFERDLCKMKFTAKSISLHDPNHYLGDVHVAWVTSEPSSNYADEIEEIRSIINETRGFYLHDFSQNMDGKGGWFAQQIFKLKMAQLLTEEFYTVLDSKNTFIREVEADSFFSPCNQAYNFAQYTMDQVPYPHNDWYHKSAEVLNLDIDQANDTLWPTSITPMTMHRQSVLDMLESIGEDPSPYTICGGPLCGMMDDGVTEFTVYQLYARFVKEFECIHKTSPRADEIAISLWRGDDVELSLARLDKVARQVLRPTMFGSQASAMDALPQEQKERVPALISQVFADAGLGGEDNEISDCIIAYQDL